MCLESISDRPTPKTLIECGWKEFSGTARQPNFMYVGIAGKFEVSLDQWITAQEVEVHIDSRIRYKTGFHIYSDEMETKYRSTSFRRVYYRHVHTVGKQDQRTVVVAREMYVPSNPDAWPPQ